MYDFLDRLVASLDHGGRFLVWSARSWVKPVSERKCPASVIAPAFAKWNMLQGLQPFLGMMALFNRKGLENFQFCQLACNHISEHEAIIISLLCSLRDARPDAVRKSLDLLVEEAAVGDLMLSLTHLGQAMSKAAIYPGGPPDMSAVSAGRKRPSSEPYSRRRQVRGSRQRRVYDLGAHRMRHTLRVQARLNPPTAYWIFPAY